MPLAIDASSPAVVTSNSATTLTTAAFTPPAGSLLIALSNWNTGTTTRTDTHTTVTGSTSAWTRVQMRALTGGMTTISWATVTSSVSTTVRTTFSGGATHGALKVDVITGQHVTTPVQSGNVTVAASTTINWTSLAVGSKLWVDYSDFVVGTTLPVNAAFTSLGGHDISGYRGQIYRQTGTTTAGSNSTTFTSCKAGASMTWIEVQPSAASLSGTGSISQTSALTSTGSQVGGGGGPTTLATETWTGTSGGWPAQWTTATVGAAGTSVLAGNQGSLHSGTTSYSATGRWLNGMTATADFDLTVDIGFATLNEQYPSIGWSTTGALRAAGDPMGAAGYSLVFYPGSGTYDLFRSAGKTVVASGSGYTFSASVRTNVQITRVGTNIKVWLWQVGGSKPGSPQINFTDGSSVAGTGKILLCAGNGSPTTSQIVTFDNLTVTDAVAGSSSRSGTGSISQTSTITGPFVPLAQWKNALAAITTTPATWLSIGESLSEGQGASTRANRYVNKVTANIRAAYPAATGGSEYVAARARVYGPDSTWGNGYTASSGTLTLRDYTTYGYADPGHKAIEMAAAATMTFTIVGTAADIWHIGGPGGGSFTYKIDGGAASAAVTQNVTPYNPHLAERVTLGTNTSHTLQIIAGAGGANIAGVEGYRANATNGLQLIDGGWSSATVALPFLSDLADWTATVEALAPDLVTIELGGNDALNNTAKATFKSQALQLITMLQGLTKVPSIVWTFPYKVAESLTPGTRFDNLQDAIEELAAVDPSINLLSFNDLMPQATTAGTGYYSTDGIHPNDTGQTFMASLVSGLLLPAASLSGTGSISQTSTLTSTGFEMSSGSGTISQTSALVSTGLKAGLGTATVNQTSALTSTGFEMAAGTAVINQTSTLTSTGDRASSGTAVLNQTHSVVSTGTKTGVGVGVIDQAHTLVAVSGKAGSGTAQVDQASALTSTGVKAGQGTATLNQSHTLVGVSGKITSGTATLDQTSALTSTGSKAASGSTSIDQTSSLSSTGVKTSSGTATINQTSTLTGTSGRVGAGPGQIDQTSTLTSTGGKAIQGTAQIDQAHTLTSTGDRTTSGTATLNQTSTTTSTGGKTALAVGTIDQTSALTSLGTKAALGTATVTASDTLTSTGIKTGAGASSIDQAHTLTATSGKVSTGTATLNQTSTLTSTGTKAASGAGSISQTSALVSTGNRSGSGTGSVGQVSDVTGSGEKVISNQGTGQISQSHALTSTGLRTALSGTGSITQTSTLIAVSGRVASGTGTLAQTSGIVVDGSKGGSGTAILTPFTTVVSTGTKQALGTAVISQGATLAGDGDAVQSGSATGTINQASTLTSSGTKDTSGSAQVVSVLTLGSTGTKAATSTGTINQPSALTGSGEKALVTASGTGQVIQGAPVVYATGGKITSGFGVIGVTSSTLGSTGLKGGRGTGAPINQPIAITVESFRQSFGFGAVSATSGLGSSGSKQTGGLGAIIQPQTLLAIGHRETVPTRDINCTFVLDDTGRLHLDLEGPRLGFELDDNGWYVLEIEDPRLTFTLVGERYNFHLELT